MKMFHNPAAIKVFFLLCICSLSQTLAAQQQDSVAVDSIKPQVAVERPRPRTLVMGSIRTNTILQNMPQYKAMQASMQALREQYEAEARKSEEDFQRKFEEFLQGKDEFPKTILEKRQNELQSILEANANFRIKVQELLAEAEKSLMTDVRAEMTDAIAVVAQDKGVSIVFDLDNGSVPYILSGLAVDLTADVIQLLGIEEEPR
jgi:outer membrane protein